MRKLRQIETIHFSIAIPHIVNDHGDVNIKISNSTQSTQLLVSDRMIFLIVNFLRHGQKLTSYRSIFHGVYRLLIQAFPCKVCIPAKGVKTKLLQLHHRKRFVGTLVEKSTRDIKNSDSTHKIPSFLTGSSERPNSTADFRRDKARSFFEPYLINQTQKENPMHTSVTHIRSSNRLIKIGKCYVGA